MSDSTSVIADLLLTQNQAAKETAANRLFNAASPAMLYALNPATTTGLTFGYIGGRFGSAPIANGTVSLTDDDDNYIVADRSDGSVSVSTATTDWDDEAGYVRLYKVTTEDGTIDSYEDHRQSIGASGGSSTPSVVTLTDAATINTDASLSDRFFVEITANRTLANPSNLIDGQRLTWLIVEGGAGGHTLTLGNKFAFDSSVTFTINTDAGQGTLLSAVYDADTDLLYCSYVSPASPVVMGTWNPAAKASFITLSGGDLTASVSSSGVFGQVRATNGRSSGHHYFEVTIGTLSGSSQRVGLSKTSESVNDDLASSADGWCYQSSIGYKGNSGSIVAYGASWAAGDVIGVEYDNGDLIFYKNGASQGTAFSGISGTVYPAWAAGPSASHAATLNVGATAFAYSLPSGASAWG